MSWMMYISWSCLWLIIIYHSNGICKVCTLLYFYCHVEGYDIQQRIKKERTHTLCQGFWSYCTMKTRFRDWWLRMSSPSTVGSTIVLVLLLNLQLTYHAWDLSFPTTCPLPAFRQVHVHQDSQEKAFKERHLQKGDCKAQLKIVHYLFFNCVLHVSE